MECIQDEPLLSLVPFEPLEVVFAWPLPLAAGSGSHEGHIFEKVEVGGGVQCRIF